MISVRRVPPISDEPLPRTVISTFSTAGLLSMRSLAAAHWRRRAARWLRLSDWPSLASTSQANAAACPSVVAFLFDELSADGCTRALARAINRPLKPVEIDQKDAPCQEHVITKDLDVNQWITASNSALVRPFRSTLVR